MYEADSQRYQKLPIRRVGDTGLQLPAISLGLWHHFTDTDPYTDRRQLIDTAFDEGVFSFDCANHYGNPFGSAERLLGRVLATDLKPYRQELVITTKVGYEIFPGPYGVMGSRKSILQGIDASLKRLKTDYVDIYYMHRLDPDTSLEETAAALDQVVREGKALYIGVSNFETAQAKEMIRLFKKLGTPFVVDQMSYNMMNRNVETSGLMSLLEENHKGIVAYGPLAEGLLSDRYLNGIPDTYQPHPTNQEIFKNGKGVVEKKLQQLNQIAQQRGQSLSQMALAWLLRNEAVASVIIGTTSIAHLKDDLEAGNNLEFSVDELTQIDHILSLTK
ncbi:Aldo keto reductase [Lactobacillus selangorensis]|uniref:Aldo keto reductase n=1 Tax=Lactobacillus selangorensis TaxID=81857 RepID=A0A0R2FZF3_9LACO|nr:aldo/keto reductase [Lactobacillus selangorensis]KRN29583.1 Aldo keto reductase [Lactobacillus selangorensis]KRN33887.1 Aldo keto reductase [Lactobacillus selangorensis]